MRFQVVSDLHLEMLNRFVGYRVIEPAPAADAFWGVTFTPTRALSPRLQTGPFPCITSMETTNPTGPITMATCRSSAVPPRNHPYTISSVRSLSWLASASSVLPVDRLQVGR